MEYKFQKSIIDQWEDCKKLTAKQLNCIIQKMDINELFEIELIYSDITNEDKYKLCTDIFYDCKQRPNLLINFKNDERLHDALSYSIKRINKGRAKRNKEIKTYYIINSLDIEIKQEYWELCDQEMLKAIKNDEFLEIIELIEVAS